MPMGRYLLAKDQWQSLIKYERAEIHTANLV